METTLTHKFSLRFLFSEFIYCASNLNQLQMKQTAESIKFNLICTFLKPLQSVLEEEES